MVKKLTKRTRFENGGLKYLRDQVTAVIPIALLQTAIMIRDDAQANCPVDTSFLQKSIYIVTDKSSDYAEAKGAAEEVASKAKQLGRTPKGVKIGPHSRYEMKPEVPPQQGKAIVAVGAEHAIVIELGGGVPSQPPKPFFDPAVKKAKTILTGQIRQMYNGVGVKGNITTTQK